jgi:hypothetical protein
LGAQKNLLFLDHLRAERRSLPMHHTRPTATTGIVSMECSRSVSRFSNRYPLLIFFACL